VTIVCPSHSNISDGLPTLLDTVISFHEDPGLVIGQEDLISIRANTLSVLSQVSNLEQESFNPISLQTVRGALNSEDDNERAHEGASNLFYYLFDDWHAAYSTVAGFQSTLSSLVSTRVIRTAKSPANTNQRSYILQNAVSALREVFFNGR
jgi:hypothetical protein